MHLTQEIDMKWLFATAITALVVSLASLAITLTMAMPSRQSVSVRKAAITTLEYQCVPPRNAVGYWGPGICPY